jgi:hypothetical protein
MIKPLFVGTLRMLIVLTGLCFAILADRSFNNEQWRQGLLYAVLAGIVLVALFMSGDEDKQR